MFWIVWLIYIVAAILLITFAYGGILAAPWVPLWRKDVQRVIQLARMTPGQTLVDLGAGDGRIILSAVQSPGIRAVGYEVAVLPFLIGWCRIFLNRNGRHARLVMKNFFKVDLRFADVVVCFLTPDAMRKLEPKFNAELKPGTKIISYAFSLPNWKPLIVDKPDKKRATIYVYEKK